MHVWCHLMADEDKNNSPPEGDSSGPESSKRECDDDVHAPISADIEEAETDSNGIPNANLENATKEKRCLWFTNHSNINHGHVPYEIWKRRHFSWDDSRVFSFQTPLGRQGPDSRLLSASIGDECHFPSGVIRPRVSMSRNRGREIQEQTVSNIASRHRRGFEQKKVEYFMEDHVWDAEYPIETENVQAIKKSKIEDRDIRETENMERVKMFMSELKSNAWNYESPVATTSHLVGGVQPHMNKLQKADVASKVLCGPDIEVLNTGNGLNQEIRLGKLRTDSALSPKRGKAGSSVGNESLRSTGQTAKTESRHKIEGKILNNLGNEPLLVAKIKLIYDGNGIDTAEKPMCMKDENVLRLQTENEPGQEKAPDDVLQDLVKSTDNPDDVQIGTEKVLIDAGQNPNNPIQSERQLIKPRQNVQKTEHKTNNPLNGDIPTLEADQDINVTTNGASQIKDPMILTNSSENTQIDTSEDNEASSNDTSQNATNPNQVEQQPREPTQKTQKTEHKTKDSLSEAILSIEAGQNVDGTTDNVSQVKDTVTLKNSSKDITAETGKENDTTSNDTSQNTSNAIQSGQQLNELKQKTQITVQKTNYSLSKDNPSIEADQDVTEPTNDASQIKDTVTLTNSPEDAQIDTSKENEATSNGTSQNTSNVIQAGQQRFEPRQQTRKTENKTKDSFSSDIPSTEADQNVNGLMTSTNSSENITTETGKENETTSNNTGQSTDVIIQDPLAVVPGQNTRITEPKTNDFSSKDIPSIEAGQDTVILSSSSKDTTTETSKENEPTSNNTGQNYDVSIQDPLPIETLQNTHITEPKTNDSFSEDIPSIEANLTDNATRSERMIGMEKEIAGLESTDYTKPQTTIDNTVQDIEDGTDDSTITGQFDDAKENTGAEVLDTDPAPYDEDSIYRDEENPDLEYPSERHGLEETEKPVHGELSKEDDSVSCDITMGGGGDDNESDSSDGEEGDCDSEDDIKPTEVKSIDDKDDKEEISNDETVKEEKEVIIEKKQLEKLSVTPPTSDVPQNLPVLRDFEQRLETFLNSQIIQDHLEIPADQIARNGYECNEAWISCLGCNTRHRLIDIVGRPSKNIVWHERDCPFFYMRRPCSACATTFVDNDSIEHCAQCRQAIRRVRATSNLSNILPQNREPPDRRGRTFNSCVICHRDIRYRRNRDICVFCGGGICRRCIRRGRYHGH